MNEIIIQKLSEIEQQENIRILHAAESGSRAWGFASPDSDYDVRFIYVRPAEYYLKLEPTRDVIELPINDLLDINGWDLGKTLRLLHSSNATLFEWFCSPIVYRSTEFSGQFRSLMPEYFSARKGLYHYLSMAEKTYREYLLWDMVRAKKYFYALRPLLACRWILKKHTPPPILFSELADSQLDASLRADVDRLLDLKMNSPEINQIPRIDAINEYLESNIAEIKQLLQHLPDSPGIGWEELNSFFLSWLER